MDFTQTQRVLLLIDLSPLLSAAASPSSYISTVLATSRTLLSFPLLSSSLFSFKLFFSSLPPLLYPLKPPLSLSFDHPLTTLSSLSHALSSLSLPTPTPPTSLSHPRFSLVSSSLSQLLHDYSWDDDATDPTSEDSNRVNCFKVRSNLVILLAPISGVSNDENDDSDVVDFESYFSTFSNVFHSVKDAFVCKDIHLSWVDVNSSNASDCPGFGFFRMAVRKFGWGYCSSDFIILGSAIVPFGLIYPVVIGSGVPRSGEEDGSRDKRRIGCLNLKIFDAKGKPLECKCCDLDLIELYCSSRFRLDCEEREESVFGQFDDESLMLTVMDVKGYDECVKIEGNVSDVVLVRGASAELSKDWRERSGEFFVYKVLEMLRTELDECSGIKSLPVWQIFLSFLYNECHWCVVSMIDGKGNSRMAILKPFTFDSAILFILHDRKSSHEVQDTLCGNELAGHASKLCTSHFNMSLLNGLRASQPGLALEDAKMRKKKPIACLHHDLDWSSFHRMAFEHSKLDLGDLCFARECGKSKKLKFLKCWVKQIKKSCCTRRVNSPDKSKPQEKNPIHFEERLQMSHDDSEQPIPSSASGTEEFLTEASRIQDDAALDFLTETSEDFASNLPKKIQDGLASNGVDLIALAERLVNASIHWLYQKHEITNSNNIGPVNEDQSPGSLVAGEITKFLLKEPKEMKSKANDNQASELKPAGFASETIIRGYELQILFRMEMLQSEVASSIEESTKQKFVKQICSFLDYIQCHMEGGFFGDWSLLNYVGKIIGNRYSETLKGVVDKIYKKMDLFQFADEDEAPNPLLNSEDSSQPVRHKQERNEDGENCLSNEFFSSENESLGSLGKSKGGLEVSKDDEGADRLIEAQERRERARRFSSFTSWMPDLQRVWAPKQPKLMSAKSDSFRKVSKRRDSKKAKYDMVCETPMTVNKRPCPWRSSPCLQNQDNGNNSCNSVSKALFQDST